MSKIFQLDSWLALVANNTHNSDRDRAAAYFLGIDPIAENIAGRLKVDRRELICLFVCYMTSMPQKSLTYRQRSITAKFLQLVDREYLPQWRKLVQSDWEKLDRVFFEGSNVISQFE